MHEEEYDQEPKWQEHDWKSLEEKPLDWTKEVPCDFNESIKWSWEIEKKICSCSGLGWYDRENRWLFKNFYHKIRKSTIKNKMRLLKEYWEIR